ncbi:AAA family ATPase [Erwinia sp. CPCC 100877]|nr:AAA family ATPase [Erwinia sp. CPCC 100877]
MKLIAIEIVGFGKWQQQTIDFQAGNQLLFGANEAGKSTIYQFIQVMLFGFSAKGKRKKDYQPKNGAAYGGRLWFQHPTFGEVQVERFKGQNKGQAKVYFNDQIGDEQTLKKILYPLTKELFQSVFTFQQEQLSQIDQLNEEQLQTSLLSLGLSGSQQLLLSREAYFKRSQALYKGKGSQPPLNQKLLDYQNLQRKINEKEQQEQPFKKLADELTQTQTQLAEKQQTLNELKAQLVLVEKQVMNLPLYDELQSLGSAAVQTGLDKKAQEQLLAIYQQYRFISEELTRLNHALVVPDETDEQQEAYHFYLQQEVLVQRLLDQRYAIDKLLAEVDWMHQSIQQNIQEMLPLERQWGFQAEQPPQLPFEEEEVAKLHEAMTERAVRKQKTQTDLRMLQEEIAMREKNLSTFETLNKEMFNKHSQQKNKKVNLLCCGLAVVFFLAAFMVSGIFRYGSLAVGILLIFAGVLPLFSQPKNSYENEKRQWQEKLSQLDYLNDQVLKTEQALKEITAEENEWTQFIAEKVKEHHLGRMDRVDYWLTHRQDITRYLLLLNTNQELEQQLKNDQARVIAITEQTEPLALHLPLAGKPLKERMTMIHKFADQMERIRFTQEHQADDYARQTMRELKEKQQNVLETAGPLLQRFGLTAIAEIPEKLQKNQAAAHDQNRKAELQTMLAGLYDEQTKVSELPQKQEQLMKNIQELANQIQQLQHSEQKLLFQRRQMLTDGTLDELYQQQAMLKAEIEELAVDWAGNQLAGQLLMDLLTELSEQQLPNLLKKAADYFCLLTESAYTALELENGQLIVVRKDQQRFMLHELSTGTKDQVIMAMRFAFLYLQDRSLCPIIIDDGWLHYDSRRKKQLAQLLNVFSQHQQVICFSSDQEMVSYYQELKQPIIELKGVEL